MRCGRYEGRTLLQKRAAAQSQSRMEQRQAQTRAVLLASGMRAHLQMRAGMGD
jgi:hypothetical protein